MTSYEANHTFPFDKLKLSDPSPMQGGGSYFTKIKCDNKTTFVQLPKSSTKHGIIKTKRVNYTDLMYDSNTNETETLVKWLETLQKTCIELINEKKKEWFSSQLTEKQIISMLSNLFRSYKGGEKTLIRAYIDSSKNNGELECRFFDKNEKIMDYADIKESCDIIPLIVVDGIRFTARSFDIQLKAVQVMMIRKEPKINVIDQCMIKHNNLEKQEIVQGIVLEKLSNDNLDNNDYSEEEDNKSDDSKNDLDNDAINTDVLEEVTLDINNLEPALIDDQEEVDDDIVDDDIVDDNADNDNADNDIDNTAQPIESANNINETDNNLERVDILEKSFDDSIKEVDIKINDEENSSQLRLKKPNDVYYEIYKIAREKAKHMKKMALKAALEAKEIKTKYMLDDLDDSDEYSDSDTDSDE
jgi:hypothetical protein